MKITSIKQVNEVLRSVFDAYSNSDKYSGFIDGQGNPAKVFFRGQSKDYRESNNVASLLRINNKDNELKHIKEYENRFQRIMQSQGIVSNLSKLVHMQHYGLNTRLLDITSCIYVAIYFAVCNDVDNDGIVYCFPNFITPINYQEKGIIPQRTQRENQPDNTSLDILTTLSYMNSDDKKYIYDESKKFTELIFKKESPFSLSDRKQLLFLLYETLCGNLWSLEELEQELKKKDCVNHSNLYGAYKLIKSKYIRVLESSQICRLLQMMKINSNEIYCHPIDFTKIFNECFFVTPIQNNPRIRAQHGYFMFQPFPETTPNSIVQSMINDQYEPQKIIIPSSYKESIQTELKQKKYSQKSLFPDEELLNDKCNNIISSINRIH